MYWCNFFWKCSIIVNIPLNNIPNLIFCYYGLVGTVRRMLYMCLIILLSCINIWTRIVITKKINYVFLWFSWYWFIIGVSMLTRYIIHRHQKNDNWFNYCWYREKLWWNKCLQHLIRVKEAWEVGCKGLWNNLGLNTLDTV